MRFAMTMLGALALTAGTAFGRDAKAADERRPAGWQPVSGQSFGGNPKDYDMRTDEAVRRGGKASATIRSKESHEKGGASMVQSIRADDYRGKRVRLTGYVKAQDVAEYAGLWLRVDGPDMLVQGFDNMFDRPVKATADWTKCELVLDVPEDAAAIVFGFMVVGKGQAWADDLKLETVDRDVPVTKEPPSRQEQEERRDQQKRDRPEQYERDSERRKKVQPTLPKQPVNMDFEGGPSKREDEQPTDRG